MEPTTNPAPNKPQELEASAYYDTLLKSQSEDDAGNPVRKYKLISLLFLISVICASLYLAVSFYINSNNQRLVAVNTTAEKQNTGAYFNPAYYSNTERKISGRINKNFNNTNDKMTAFQLLDDEGKNLAYLYSKNNDLNLSLGLEVEIQGELRRSMSDGKEVIEVLSIKLK
jgi:hypothetical protein